MSTSTESPPLSRVKAASQSSQFEASRKLFGAGVSESVFDDELEQLLSGEDCRADGMAQKEWRLDCWVDGLVDGSEGIGFRG